MLWQICCIGFLQAKKEIYSVIGSMQLFFGISHVKDQFVRIVFNPLESKKSLGISLQTSFNERFFSQFSSKISF